MAQQARPSSDPRRLLLERLDRGPLTASEATKGLTNGHALLEALVASGLVAAVPPTPPQRSARYALTDEGRRELERQKAADRVARPKGSQTTDRGGSRRTEPKVSQKTERTSPQGTRRKGAQEAGAKAPVPEPNPPWAPLADRVEGLSAGMDALRAEVRELAARVDALAGQFRAAAARLEAVERLVGRDGRPAGEGAAGAGQAGHGGTVSGRPAGEKAAAAGGLPGYGGGVAGERAHAGAAGGPRALVSTEEFERLLYRAYDELDRRQGHLGLVPIPRLREALAGQLAADEFERHLRELAKSRRVFLVPHDQPSTLSEAERQASIEDRVLGQLYYWVRWKG